jgi:hypothetical protein
MDPNQPPILGRGRKNNIRSTNFTFVEDEAICRAWIYVTEDSIVGAGQRVAHFWERIYVNFKQRVGDDTRRTKDSLSARFGVIQRACSRWAGIISTTERTARSGTTIQDRLAEAKTSYYLSHKSHFQLEHCWILLKESPKWNEAFETRSSTTITQDNIFVDVDDEVLPVTPLATVGGVQIDPFPTQIFDGCATIAETGSGSGSGGVNKKKRPAGTKGEKERVKKELIITS